jgi:hypothetical protein
MAASTLQDSSIIPALLPRPVENTPREEQLITCFPDADFTR